MFEVYLNDGSTSLPKDDIFYMIGKNGIFIKRKNELSESVAKVDKISILKDVESYSKLNIKKIKASDFSTIIEFFKAAYKKYRSESIVKLYYNKVVGEYNIEVPKQKVSATGIKYENQIQEYKKDLQDWVLVGTIHCHGDMGAFHSPTDHHDEKDFDGLHITVGNINDDYFTLSVSVMANGNRFKVNPSEYIYGLEKQNNYIKPIEPIKPINNIYATYIKPVVPEDRYQVISKKRFFKFNPIWMNQVSQDVVFGAIGKYKQIYEKCITPFSSFHESLKRKAQPGTLDNVPENPCKTCIFRDLSMKLNIEDVVDDVELENNYEGLDGNWAW